MKKPTTKLGLQRETIRPLQSTDLQQIAGGSLSGGTSVISVSSGTSVISVSSGTSVISISRNPSGGSHGAPSGG